MDFQKCFQFKTHALVDMTTREEEAAWVFRGKVSSFLKSWERVDPCLSLDILLEQAAWNGCSHLRTEKKVGLSWLERGTDRVLSIFDPIWELLDSFSLRLLLPEISSLWSKPIVTSVLGCPLGLVARDDSFGVSEGLCTPQSLLKE